MCAVHDGRCSPWVMCSVVSDNQIHDSNEEIRLSLRNTEVFEPK